MSGNSEITKISATKQTVLNPAAEKIVTGRKQSQAGAAGIPAYLCDNVRETVSIVIDYIMDIGVTNVCAQETQVIVDQMPILESFSTSADNQEPFFVKTKEGAIDRKVVNFKSGKPVNTSYFSDEKGHPVLYNVSQYLLALLPKEKQSVAAVDPKEILTQFQSNCAKFNIWAKLWEEKDPKKQYQLVKVDSILGRQTVRAMVFVYELGKLEQSFGFVKDFDEYVKMFNSKKTEEYLNNVLEFKKFINSNPKIKSDIMKGEEISEPETASIKGNTGEAIIALYHAGNVGAPNLLNIFEGTKFMIRNVIKPEDTAKLKSLPAMIEAKKILYCLRNDKDGIRKFMNGVANPVFDGSWALESEFDSVLRDNITDKRVIDSVAATALLAKCKNRITEIAAVLNGTDPDGLLKNVNNQLVSNWKEKYDGIINDPRLKYNIAEKLFQIDKIVVDSYLTYLKTVGEKEARDMLKIARNVHAAVIAYPKDRIAGFSDKVNENKLNAIADRIEAHAYKEAYNTALQAAYDGYNKYIELTAKDYKGMYDQLKAEVESIDPEISDALTKLDDLRKKVNSALVEAKKKYDLSVKEAEDNGISVGTPPKLDRDYMLDIADIIKKKNDEILLWLGAKPLIDDLALMRKLIEDRAVKIDMGNKNNNDIDEFKAILGKLDKINEKPDDLQSLSKLYAEIKAAGNKTHEVLNKLLNCQDMPYYTKLKGRFDGHVQYFRDEVAKKIKDIENDELSKITLAFTIGEGDILSDDPDSGDDIAIALSYRKKLYYLDRRVTPIKVERSYRVKASQKRQYLGACGAILSNPKKYKALLKRAEEMYNYKVSSIIINKEAYLEPYEIKILNDMGFKDCMRTEIAGIRLSFAGTALAQAYAESKSLPVEDKNKEILPDGKEFFRGVPKGLLDDFIKEYTPGKKGVK